MRLLLAVPVVLMFALSCAGGSTTGASNGGSKNGLVDRVVRVTVVGASLGEAEKIARARMVERALGSFVESKSKVSHAALISYTITARSSGFVYDFRIIRKGWLQPRSAGLKLTAEGRVRRKRLKEALAGRYKQLGSPRFMAIFSERLANGESAHVTEDQLAAGLPTFRFVSPPGSLRRTYVAARGAAHKGAAVVAGARAQPADILILGRTRVNASKPFNSFGERRFTASIDYRVMSLGSRTLLASGTATGSYNHQDLDGGSRAAIGQAAEVASASIRKQVLARWRSGNVIRMEVTGMTLAEIVQLRLRQRLAGIYGVRAVQLRGRHKTATVLEVTAFFNGPRLLERMQAVSFLKRPRTLQVKSVSNYRLVLHAVP